MARCKESALDTCGSGTSASETTSFSLKSYIRALVLYPVAYLRDLI